MSSKASTRQTAVTAVLLTSSVAALTYRILQWRARRRAMKTVERVKDMTQEGGPLIDYNDVNVRNTIITKATRRASKWISLNEDVRPIGANNVPQPMTGQVGGVAKHKKSLLSIEPDYVLKPLITDFRGVREIAFYEAIKTVSSHNSNNSSSSMTQTYATFLRGPTQKGDAIDRIGELFDTLAVALAIWLKDPIVAESEGALKEAWRRVKREIEAFQNLAKFTSPYYGVLGQEGACHESEYGINDNAHLLLQDLTANYSQPCVMDLKLGDQTYEPDAPEEKRLRESSKYPEQAKFGFRIIGMRIYSPGHPDADENGYRRFRKNYGQSIKTKTAIVDALRLFFSAGAEDIASDSKVNRTEENEAKNDENDGEDKADSGDVAATEDPHEPIRVKTLQNTLAQLRPIRRWFDDNRSLRFYASSLLIVYEGDTSSEKNMGNRDYASIKMIDFARVRRSSEGDPGYILGLRNIRNYLTQILEEEQRRIAAPAPSSSGNNSGSTRNVTSNKSSSGN